MSTGDAFLRAICKAPADDAPRLVYADWLDENGEAGRAEFIRIQCELVRRGHDCHPNYSGSGFHAPGWGGGHEPPSAVRLLLDRQQELWEAGVSRPDLPPAMAKWEVVPYRIAANDRVRLRRGFVEWISCKWKEFFAVAADLFARQPIMYVDIRGFDPASPAKPGGDFEIDCESSGPPPPYRSNHIPRRLRRYFAEIGITRFARPGEAEAAVSWACVRYGRSTAGLE